MHTSYFIRSLPWLAYEERRQKAKVALLTEFGMTLPPETGPLRRFGRAGQLN